MNEIYNMADVMFLPSYEELFPMTILESMNCAVPVLVRNLPIYDPILFDYALRGDGMDAFVSTLKQLREALIFIREAPMHPLQVMNLQQGACGTDVERIL